MKRPDNNTNNNSSKRLKQDQQLSFNEDVAEIHIYRNGINGDGNSNDTNIIPNELPQAPIRNNMSRLITSSDEEDDGSIGRRWLSSGQRRAPRLGSEFQAYLPTPV
eukprot:881711_1